MGLDDSFYLRSKNFSKFNNEFKKFFVDVLSGWTYYTPMYAFQEFITGNDSETIVKTRLAGLLAQAIVMRPVGLLRNHVANELKVYKESPLVDKLKVNLLSITPMQALVYAGMLSTGVNWSSSESMKSATYAWLLGVGFSAIHAFPYGAVQEKFRKLFGSDLAFKNKY